MILNLLNKPNRPSNNKAKLINKNRNQKKKNRNKNRMKKKMRKKMKRRMIRIKMVDRKSVV